MLDNVGRWLEELGLGEYVEAFAENRIDADVLPTLTIDDLKDIGILAVGDRRKILNAVMALSERDDETTSEAASKQGPSGQTERTIDAERRQLTVMFCDLVGSTELSARLDPEDLREVMRRYQDTVAGLVARFEGHVAKFLGDGVLAFFGWPRAYEDQAERAVRSGMAAVDAVANLKTEDDQPLEARVGIATGQVVIGDIVGEAATEADAVAGETPNLAARLLEVASPGQVVIGATTRLLIGEALDIEDIGTHQLKGFAESVAVWRVVGESAAESRFEAAHPGALAHIVGREHELGLLKRAWQQSQAGVGQVVLISGEPGIGKSRLVDALSVELGDKGYTRITLGCSPYHTNSALFPVIVHLERALRWQREDSADVKLAKLEEALRDFSLPLDEAIPLFASLLSLPLPDDRYPPISVTPQQQKQQTLDAIVAWLLEEAERQPVLHVWEDLHWADPSTLELLALEIEQTPTVPILNVLTFRPDFAPPWPQRSHITPLTLNRLERPEVETLVGQHAGGKTLPEEVVEHIVDKTDGVPLYVEELTKAILEADFLHETAAGYELAGPLSDLAIPATLQDSLMARLDRLPSIREVAQLGAVLGREFAYEMVQAIASIEETTLQEGLAQLVDAELLYQRGRPPRAKYIFKHALVQDAAYQSLLRRTRQYYHRQVAELLERQFAEIVEAQPELVAHHLTEAGMAEPAIAYWQQAGERAGARSALAEAVTQLTKAIELLGGLDESVERDARELDLQIALAGPLIAVKGYAGTETDRAYRRALELCDRVGDPQRIFPVLYGRWAYHYVLGHMTECEPLSAEFVRRADGQSDPVPRVVAHRVRGTTLLVAGQPAGALEHLSRAYEIYDPENHQDEGFRYGQDVRVATLVYQALTLWYLGLFEEAQRRSREALDRARQLGHANTLGYTLFHTSWLRMLSTTPAEVLEMAEDTIAHSQEHRMPLWAVSGQVMRSWSLLQEDCTAARITMLEKDLREYVEYLGLARPMFLTWLATAYGVVKQPEKGQEIASETQALIESTGEAHYQAELCRVRGELELIRGADGEAEVQFEQALATARRQSIKPFELRAATSIARLRRDQGKPAAARDLLAPVFDWFTEGFDTPDLMVAKALLDELS